MSQLFEISPVSLDPSLNDIFAPLYATEAAAVQPTLATAVPAIEDTVTLSAEAVNSASSSNVVAFTTPAPNSVAAQVNALAAFNSEYPLQHLLDVGYSPSEIANLFGLPDVSSSVSAVHTFDSAA